MKTGRNLQDVATEILRQAQTKRDFIVPTTLMDFEYLDTAEPGPDFRLRWDNQEPMPLTRRAHEQLAGHLNIPQKFYDRLYADHPDILSFNVAELLHRQPSTRMVRTLDGNVRALLSNRYRPIDNLEIAETVLPILTDTNGFHIESAEVTDSRFYIKALTDRVSGEVMKGDMVQGGIVISNSEVGAGAVKVEPLVYRLVCLNGMIASDSTLRKMHLGSNGNGDGAYEFFRDDTRQISDQALMLQIRDTVNAVCQQPTFDLMLERFRESAAKQIIGDVPKVVEALAKELDFSEKERGGILQHLIRGGDLSQWGLANAVTRTSQDVDSYDRATELERAGYSVITLNQSKWESISAAN